MFLMTCRLLRRARAARVHRRALRPHGRAGRGGAV